MSNSDKVVLFADMLGFARLTEKHSIDRLSSINLDSINSFLEKSNPLEHAFSKFHYSLKWRILQAKMWHPITAITFSDSVFIATSYLYETVQIGVDLIQSMMSQKVPLRIGIAYGSFAALAFKSDISSDGGDHASQFLGTAVVRAHLAESCGIKGIRILLHPSAIPLLKDKTHNPESQSVLSQPIHYLECAEKEQKNKADVHYEVDYWNFKVKRNAEGSWKGLQDMWKDAPENETVHYIATAEAIERMRMTHGEKPLKNLRRRTLPI